MAVNYKSFFLKFFSATLIVRFLTLFKDMLLGWIIGPTKMLDIFFFLVSIPAFLNSTWNKALETVLITNYEQDIHHADKIYASNQLGTLTYKFTILSFVIYIVISAALPVIILYFFDDYLLHNLIYIVCIINLIFVIETYLLGIKVLCYSEHRFFLPSILPIFQSSLIIIGLLVSDKLTLLLLAILFTSGSLLQSLFFLKKEFRFLILAFKKSFKSENIITFLKQITQLSLASGLSSLNLIIDQSFALNLGKGANTYIHYGNYFLLIFTYLFVQNISMIFFPQFQKYAINNQKEQLEQDAQKIARISLILGVSIIMLIINNGYFILKLFLGYGKISRYDLEIIYYCTVAYGGAFLGLGLNAILVRILNAYGDYRMILYVALINSVLNICLNYIFVQLFGIWGIALSTSVTILILILIYMVYLNHKYKIALITYIDNPWIKRFIASLLIISALELVFLNYFTPIRDYHFLTSAAVLTVNVIILFGIFYSLKIVKIKNFNVTF